MNEPLSTMIERISAYPIARFAGVGVIATAIDFAVFSALVFGLGVPTAPSNALSYATSLFANFNLNRRWTFQQKKDARAAARQGGRFLLANAGGLILSTAIVGVLALMTPELVAKLISVPFVFVWNYALARFWVFREERSDASEQP